MAVQTGLAPAFSAVTGQRLDAFDLWTWRGREESNPLSIGFGGRPKCPPSATAWTGRRESHPPLLLGRQPCACHTPPGEIPEPAPRVPRRGFPDSPIGGGSRDIPCHRDPPPPLFRSGPIVKALFRPSPASADGGGRHTPQKNPATLPGRGVELFNGTLHSRHGPTLPRPVRACRLPGFRCVAKYATWVDDAPGTLPKRDRFPGRSRQGRSQPSRTRVIRVIESSILSLPVTGTRGKGSGETPTPPRNGGGE